MSDVTYETLDERFARCVRTHRAPRPAVRGLPLGRGAGLVRRRPLPRLERHPQRPDAALGRADRRGRRLPLAGGQLQRQHGRPPGAAGHLRARRPARHAHRARRLDHRDRRPFEGKRLNSPNDVVVRSDGSIWFTDPVLRDRVRLRGQPGRPRARRAATSSASTRTAPCRIVADDFVRPNGLAFSLDERRLYVSDTGAERRRTCARSRSATTARSPAARCSPTSTNGGFDGFRLDDAGRIWTSAGDGVHCLDPDGTLLGKVRIPEVVANVEFGGPKRHRLFICATTSLYSVHLMVTGPRRWAASDRRRDRLVRPGPRRHRHADRGERLGPERAELEPGADRDRKSDAGLDLDDLLALIVRPPHLPPTADEEPDLLDRAMNDGDRRLAGRQFEVRHRRRRRGRAGCGRPSRRARRRPGAPAGASSPTAWPHATARRARRRLRRRRIAETACTARWIAACSRSGRGPGSRTPSRACRT